MSHACSRLRLDSPPERWLDAYPVGNGRLGAMVFGGTAHERLALNHENLWRGTLKYPEIPEAHRQLPEIRAAFLAGDILRGTAQANAALGGPKYEEAGLTHIQPFQPLGDLELTLELDGAISDYQHELDLETAVVTTSFASGTCRIVRRVFVSAVDQVLVLEVVSSEVMSGTLALSRIPDPDAVVSPWRERDSFGFDAEFAEGIRFGARAHVQVDEGELHSVRAGSLAFDGVRRVVVRLALATDYRGESPSASCRQVLEQAPREVNALLRAHLAEYQTLYGRVAFELEGTSGELATDQRVQHLQSGAQDPALFALYFNYGRYLLLASSRKCEQPANLQGLWNEHLRPCWDSDYHADINLQMNYWPAEICGLPECSDVLLAFLERHKETSRLAARRYFNCRGLFYQSGDIWKMNWMSAQGWDVWTGGAAWFAQHFFWRWQYSQDIEFLREHAYPFVREVAEFYEDFLVEDGQGHLVTIPSQSPENKFIGGAKPVSLCIGATMDYLLIREVLGNAIEASQILDVDSEARVRWASILERIPPFQIGKHGQLQEWQEDYEEQEPGHRHVSHLYGVHPANLMTPNRLPEFFEAARVSLKRRMEAGGGHTGWSRAAICCLWARFGEAEQAYVHLSHLLTDYNTKSLLDTHPMPQGDVFQIDGNFGAVAAIAELLVQFHDGYIELLPCLPSAWSTGNIRGLRTWGGFEVNMEWRSGSLSEALIVAHVREDLSLKLPAGEWLLICGAETSRVVGGEVLKVPVSCGKSLLVRPVARLR
ncbi:MAG: glycoside hydrolase family 95 protein [Polyangiaceae bacterium]|nr:glycoside hydrolase family 95 protein [Polyangiaceae bacterium]